jgi:hypothetical protein
MILRSTIFAAALTLIAGEIRAQPTGTYKTSDEDLRKALTDEMARAMKDLRIKKEAPPHYIAYTITDFDQAEVDAEFGARTGEVRNRGRQLQVEVRVGDRNEDSGNSIFSREPQLFFPIEDDYQALRRDLWLHTDEAYKHALGVLSKKRGAEKIQGKGDLEGVLAFATVKPSHTVFATPGSKNGIDVNRLVAPTTHLSALFRQYPGLQEGRVVGRQRITRTRILTSEGSWLDAQSSYAMIMVNANTQAEDGRVVRAWIGFNGETAQTLPPLAEMEKTLHTFAADLTATSKAPIADHGNAVVLFEGIAAARILHRLLAEQISGTPLPSTLSSTIGANVNALADKIGQSVGPKFLHAYDDPSLERGPGNVFLFGSYRTDDEGVPGERVDLIKEGVLKTLLMSRTPRKEIAISNGHGRGNLRGGAIRARTGVLVVHAGKAAIPDPTLRTRALREGKMTGPNTAVYIVRDFEQSRLPGQPVSYLPTLVSRLSSDGKEEPVRGIYFANLLPRSLKDLVAMGKTQHVYNYRDERPGTVVAPSLILRDVEVKKLTGKPPRLPLYPHPYFAVTPKP